MLPSPIYPNIKRFKLRNKRSHKTFCRARFALTATARGLTGKWLRALPNLPTEVKADLMRTDNYREIIPR
jgi:hypothetical protein